MRTDVPFYCGNPIISLKKVIEKLTRRGLTLSLLQSEKKKGSTSVLIRKSRSEKFSRECSQGKGPHKRSPTCQGRSFAHPQPTETVHLPVRLFSDATDLRSDSLAEGLVFPRLCDSGRFHGKTCAHGSK
ncbi:hypothetical protein CEXT_331951 [Caerostris extrusa]|uniref:Uncharacterized protein n=1 Tax=Caerostris extrusa TaxID=172846 RepID=A0AAV4VS55_CAEEX|nr:hypothetical protein CEXT_331951 [Caerostris extrusa]